MSSLACTPDKTRLLLRSGAIVAWCRAVGITVVAGDPLVDGARMPAAIAEVVVRCRAERRPACFLQTAAQWREAYRAAGLRVLKFGEEAVVDLLAFDLASPRRANLRREVQRAVRGGLEAVTFTAPRLTCELRAGMANVSRAWLRAGRWRELGFSLGRFDDPVDPESLHTVVRDRDGAVQAFACWLPMGAGGIAVDMMRRHPRAPAGSMDLCIVQAIDDARGRGLRRLSLGVAPFLDEEPEPVDGARAAAIRRMMFRAGAGRYRYVDLARFKAKFAPRWESRDVAIPRGPAALAVPPALWSVHFRRHG